MHPPRMLHKRVLYLASARVVDKEVLLKSARYFMAGRPTGFVLTKEMVARCSTCHVLSRFLRRVRVHLPNGTRIGLAGVGEGDERLTFPSDYCVAKALQSPDWVRFADTSDGTSAWCVALDKDRTPKSLVYKDGTIAYDYENIGRHGDWVTALVKQPPTLAPITSKECLDVSGVRTPQTPGYSSDDSGRCVR